MTSDDEGKPGAASLEDRTTRDDDGSMVVLVLDPDGQRSAVAAAVRRAGHRVVTATGLESAMIVLSGLTPDLVLVRSVGPTEDHRAITRLTNVARAIPIRAVTSSLTIRDLSPAWN